MSASAFHYVWPAQTTLKLRLMLCLLLVLGERVINLAAPIAFKNMVEVLSAVVTAPPDDPAAAAGQQGEHPVLIGVRRLLMAAGAMQQQQLLVTGVGGGANSMLHAAASSPVAGVFSSNTSTAQPGVLAAGMQGGSDVALAPFWVLFYPVGDGDRHINNPRPALPALTCASLDTAQRLAGIMFCGR